MVISFQSMYIQDKNIMDDPLIIKQAISWKTK